MYISERDFVREVIACLVQLKVSEFPYDTEDFKCGAEAMQNYFNEHEQEMGDNRDELGMLFIREPLGGGYEELERAFSSFNGSIVSFANPSYIVAKIKLAPEGSEFILSKKRSCVPSRHIKEFARLFCEKGNCLVCE